MPKAKIRADKVVSMAEAIEECVRPGCSVYIEGFTHLIGFAAGHEIIRRGVKNLHAIRLTPDIVYDQLIEAGCIKKLTFSWAGNPGVGSLHALRRKTQAQSRERIEIEEYSHFGMVARLQAGSSNLPFWPIRNFNGTDIAAANEKIKKVQCPFTGEVLSAVPPLKPDVTIVHCQRADRLGNAQVWGLMGTQKETSFAAKKLIVVAEEIVDTELIRSDPNRTLIPNIIVDFVVCEPFGAHPSYAQGYYDRDNEFYVNWDKISRDPKTYLDYLNEFVHGVKNREEYRKKMDSKLLAKLKAKSKVCEGVDYGY